MRRSSRRRSSPSIRPASRGHPNPEARTAVVEDDRRTKEKPTYQVIPHHPAGAREPEESVACSEVIVEGEDFEMLEQNTAVAGNDWLREPRRARRGQHPERMLGPAG